MRRMAERAAALALAALLLGACGKTGQKPAGTAVEPQAEAEAPDTDTGAEAPGIRQMEELTAALPAGEEMGPFRTTYEVFVYSFADSDGDGIGDLKGLTESLDYINDGKPGAGEDLGCGRIWLMPIFPSPTYHKYDTTDYMDIDPSYGTLEDFDALLSACHERDVEVILDLALNHTSVDHPWFREAADYLRALAPGQDPVKEDCPYVWYYTFSREAYDGYAALPDSDWYYEARFWEGMPDLNLETPEVREELDKVFAFWLDRGADGFRLDALTSYYTNDRPASIAFTDWAADRIHAMDPDAYLVGECWTSMEDYARFYETGIDSLFDFAFAGQEGVIAEAVRGGKGALAFGRAMEEEEALFASVREDAVNAPFYTNHDMARGAGYYAYDDGTKTKLALGLNFLQTGSAFLYYGEELGMKGAGKDENKRAAMYWTGEGEAADPVLTARTCQGPPDMDSFSMKFDPWDVQTEDPASILSYVRDAVRIREAFPVLAGGRTHVIEALSDQEVLAFVREGKEDAMDPVLVLVSLSEEEKTLDLAGTEAEEYKALSAVLSAQGGAADLEGGRVTLPPCGIAVLTR